MSEDALLEQKSFIKEQSPVLTGPIVSVDGVVKAFDMKLQTIIVLRGLTFTINKGDFLVIFGPSGCGKSTLLHVLLGLEPPTKGTVHFLGKSLYDKKNEDDRAQFRKQHIGMVYQQSNWIKSLSVLENVAFPLMLLGNDKASSLEKGYEMLKLLNLERFATYGPTELSGGQQQRVAVARAMVTDPEVLFADEPTGNLDYEAGQNLMLLLQELSEKGKTIIMVTHDMEYVKFAKKALNLKDGRIEHMYEGDEMNVLTEMFTYKKKGADFQQ